jgi:hypothetical protein
MDYGHRWVVVAVIWVGLGCGPQVAAPDGASSDTGTAGTGSGDETGDTTATRPDVGVADGTTAAPISCEEFGDEAREGPAQVIEILNVGDAPILLDSPCFNYDYLELDTSTGGRWPGGFCATTCEEAFRFGCFDCDGCAQSSYTVVNPGQRVEVSWPGVLFQEVTPPVECWQTDPCEPTCSRLRLPEREEEITVSVAAITHADCIAAEPDPSVCDCPAPGRCESYGQTSVEPTLFATATFDAGSSGPIVLELDG